MPVSFPAKTSIAVWAPHGHTLAYVLDNDLYIRRLADDTPIRLTSDGNATRLNGVPDWIYEEEVRSISGPRADGAGLQRRSRDLVVAGRQQAHVHVNGRGAGARL